MNDLLSLYLGMRAESCSKWMLFIYWYFHIFTHAEFRFKQYFEQLWKCSGNVMETSRYFVPDQHVITIKLWLIYENVPVCKLQIL